jgi:DNA-binding MarR family transcriptional regulator
MSIWFPGNFNVHRVCYNIESKGNTTVSHSANHPSGNRPDLEPLIAEIMGLLARVSEKLEPDNNEIRQWMARNFRNPVIVLLLQDTTVMMLRVLDAIGRLEPVNGITISKEFKIPKGSVSKTTRRLIAKKLISKESLPNNKKEVLFRLTPLGRELFQAHRAFDQQMEKEFVQFLQRYDADQLGFLVSVLQDIAETSFLNPEAIDKTHQS